jgi:hypothetical protein
VYFRYEDEYSARNFGNGQFTVGVILKEFRAFTTGKDWKESGL